MLRKIRTILAAVVFVLITLLFLDFTGTLHHWLSWLAKIQFLPAVMALNVVVIVAIRPKALYGANSWKREPIPATAAMTNTTNTG